MSVASTPLCTGSPMIWLKRLGRLKGGAGFPDAEQNVPGEEIPFYKVKHLEEADSVGCMQASEHTVSAETAARLGAFVFPSGAIVFAKVGAALTLNRFRYLGRPACIDNNMMGIIVEQATVEPRFLLFAMSSLVDLGAVANPGAVPSVNAEQIGEHTIPVPNLGAQRAIVAYLDRETARIDALIAAKQRVLDLLAEKRKAIIATAVTRGLDPEAEMRGSGVPWLGEIPVGWKVTRLKFVARVQTGIALGKDYGGQVVSEFPYLRVANVQDGFIDVSEIKTIAVPEREAAGATLLTGDILMNEGGDADKLGRGAIWDGAIAPCLHQNHVFALRPTAVSSEWIATWTGAAFAKAYFETRAKQSTNLASISSTNLLELPIAIPSDKEQKTIVAHIARETSRLDAVRAATERTITLLKERRAALIAAAVTGQLDVGGEE